MLRIHGAIALALIAASPVANAQLWGSSPFQNGVTPEQGALYSFDPDTLTWIDGKHVTLPGFTICGITGLTVLRRCAGANEEPLCEGRVERV